MRTIKISGKIPKDTEVPGINKYQFCVGCEYIRKTSRGEMTCPSRFDPYEPMTEPDGSPRKDGREGCPKNQRYMEMQKRQGR